MKSKIVYYTFTGNTKAVALVLAEYFEKKGEVEVVRIESLDDTDSVFDLAAMAFRHKRTEIEPLDYSLKDLDVICVGTPVWAFGPATAMNTYLDNCFGFNEKKEIILFTTYSSGIGNSRCLNYMQDILYKKGARIFNRFSIHYQDVRSKSLIIEAIEKARDKDRLQWLDKYRD